ncbi:MAG: type IX secretion system protein PorQ [Chlorobi bacterium]|nr:type IX secretion system protein PorQ [Chlorobiota bacterium]
MRNINILIILIFFPFFINAQVGGDGVFTFLEIPNSAKVASLGGANISIYNDDLNMAFQNPALLNSDMERKVVLNYVNYFTDINLGSVAYAFNNKKIGTIAIGLQFLDYGKFISADATGIIIGDFSASDYALNIIWSKQLFKNITGGINIKPLYSSYETYTSFGIVADVGISYINTEKEMATSLTLKNIGTQLKPFTDDNYESIPFDIQLGFSKKLNHAPFRVNITAHHLNTWDLTYDVPEEVTTISFAEDDTDDGDDLYDFLDNSFRHLIVGIEIIPLKSFYASIAYNHQRRQEMAIVDKSGFTGFSWGFGIKLKKFGFSFGKATYHLAGSSSYFSLYADLSKFGKTKNVKVD